MVSFARKIFPVANSVPSPSVIFTILLPELLNWSFMTEAGLWFLFCFAFSPPTKRKTLKGLFSTFRQKINPPNAGEYCIIVVLKKNRLTFYRHDYTSEWFEKCCMQASVWQRLISKDWNLKGNGSLIQQNQIFFSDVSFYLCFFLSAWEKLPHLESQLFGRGHAEALLTVYVYNAIPSWSFCLARFLD